jgi:preprotein translocase subunit SecB
MAQEGKGDGQSAAAAEELMVNAQYVKDLSFENPRAPQSLLQPKGQPEVELAVDVKARNLAPETFEVVLTFNVTTRAAGEPLFLVELAYGTVVTVKNASEERLRQLLLVEVPRFIFPFARAVVADATRDGGFPPLLINPIDFAELARRNEALAAAPQAGFPAT